MLQMAGDKIKNALIAARARNSQEVCFGPKERRDPFVQSLYKRLATAQKEQIKIDLRSYHAQTLIAAEYLFIRRYLFPLVTQKSTRKPVMEVRLHHAKVNIEYKPWHGHFGNFFAHILNAPQYRYATKYRDLSIAIYEICKREKKKQSAQARPEFEQNFSVALGRMLVFYLKTGQDAFEKYGKGYNKKKNKRSFYLRLSKKTNVSFALSKEDIVLIEFLFYILGVKEVARRLGVNAYHGVHYDQRRCAACYGKGIGFALYHAVALDLIKNGALLFWEYIDPDKPCSLFATNGMTRFSPDAQGIHRTREKCQALTQLWQKRSGKKYKLSQSQGVQRLFKVVFGIYKQIPSSRALPKSDEDRWDQADQYGHILNK